MDCKLRAKNCGGCPYYGKSARESKDPAVKMKTVKIAPPCSCNPPRPVIS